MPMEIAHALWHLRREAARLIKTLITDVRLIWNNKTLDLQAVPTLLAANNGLQVVFALKGPCTPILRRAFTSWVQGTVWCPALADSSGDDARFPRPAPESEDSDESDDDVGRVAWLVQW